MSSDDWVPELPIEVFEQQYATRGDPAVGGAVEYLLAQARFGCQNSREEALSEKCADYLRAAVAQAGMVPELLRRLKEAGE